MRKITSNRCNLVHDKTYPDLDKIYPDLDKTYPDLDKTSRDLDRIDHCLDTECSVCDHCVYYDHYDLDVDPVVDLLLVYRNLH